MKRHYDLVPDNLSTLYVEDPTFTPPCDGVAGVRSDTPSAFPFNAFIPMSRSLTTLYPLSTV